MIHNESKMNNLKITAEGSLLLAFTSLAYLYATPFAPSQLYELMIRMNTLFNFIFHLSNSSQFSHINVFYHASTASWYLLDAYYSWNTPMFYHIAFLNIFMTSIPWTLPWLEQKRIIPYAVSHSVWHLMSAAKAIYVAASLNSLQYMKEVV
jgi:hypothetical protein